MMVAHLTNAAQGEMSQSSPWDLWPGRGHHKGDHGRGREYDIGERSRNYSTEEERKPFRKESSLQHRGAQGAPGGSDETSKLI